MLELGEKAADIHRETGRKIAASGVDILIGVRGLAEDLVDGARHAGLADARFAVDSDTAGEMLVSLIEPGDAVLVKGSRGVRTEKVLEALFERHETEV
jgi:UDP-N-acetylmuramoyl-tripeptide--D-alanyl-D-alanine ligase